MQECLRVRALLGSPMVRAFFSTRLPNCDLIEALVRHQFTYNIRELDALLWKAIAESPRNFVRLTQATREALKDRGALGETERSEEPSAEQIVDTLEKNAHNVARSASALGLSSRYALYRLMRKHGIVVERANNG